nr:reverse transcriptase domain-containing protein [Tanacetum cinerariifolium]
MGCYTYTLLFASYPDSHAEVQSWDSLPRASAMANTTPLVTTVTKPAINPVEANSTPRVNIQKFCEEHYEDILPIIMEKVRHDRRKDVHTRLDFREGPRERIREDSYYTNTRTRVTEPGRVKLSETYSPSTTKSRPQKTDSKNFSWGRSRTRSLSASRDGRHKDRECLRGTRESYDDSFPHSYRDESHYHHMKRKRDKSPQSSASRSDSSDRKYQKSRRHQPTDEDDLKNHGCTRKKIRSRLESAISKAHERHECLTMTPKEILATEGSKFQPSPPMVMPVEKRSSNKFCDFHNDKGHSTNECMQPKKQIEELVRAGKLSHLIKEIKQGRDQSKAGKKETAVKDKPTVIHMVQSWQRTVKQKVTQSFEWVEEIAFPKLAANNGTKGPLIIEA